VRGRICGYIDHPCNSRGVPKVTDGDTPFQTGERTKAKSRPRLSTSLGILSKDSAPPPVKSIDNNTFGTVAGSGAGCFPATLFEAGAETHRRGMVGKVSRATKRLCSTQVPRMFRQ
jgi:hypothetical protein